MRKINGIIRSSVRNEVTLKVAYQAIGGEGNLKTWPGTTFRMSEDNGKALAGTPNMYGILYSLWQHPDDWGGKKLHSVTVFKDGRGELSLFIILENEDGDTPPYAEA